MAQTARISEIRNQYISELKDFESELSRQLKEVRNELSRLIPGLKTRQSSAITSKETDKTVSILSGKVCPKCGKKGHDMRWHRWHDKKATADGRKKTS
jgi:hypothetical protein